MSYHAHVVLSKIRKHEETLHDQTPDICYIKKIVTYCKSYKWKEIKYIYIYTERIKPEIRIQNNPNNKGQLMIWRLIL